MLFVRGDLIDDDSWRIFRARPRNYQSIEKKKKKKKKKKKNFEEVALRGAARLRSAGRSRRRRVVS